MKIRIFGSEECQDCLMALFLLKQAKINFEYIDAFADDKQDFCDECNVDELPHLQFIDDSDIIIMEHVGPIEVNHFMQYLIDYFPNN